MPKTTAQKIALFSVADRMSIPADRQQERANGGVFATAYSLMRGTVSCRKGSVISIMSTDFSGDEMVELVKIAVKRDIQIVSAVSFDGLTSEANTLRAAVINALTVERYDLAQRYALLLLAIDRVEWIRKDVALSEYWHARFDLEKWDGDANGRIIRRGAVIVHGKAAGLTDEQIAEDIDAIMEARAKIAA